MIDLYNLCFTECDRKSSCTYGCETYAKALRENNLETEKINLEHIKNFVLPRFSEEADILTGEDNMIELDPNNPLHRDWFEEDNLKDVKVLHLNIDRFTPEKKEELVKMIECCSGVRLVEDMGDLDVSKNKKCNECENDLEDFMENLIVRDVSTREYLQVVNGLRELYTIIDKDVLIEYMAEKNRVYCEEEGICEKCRSPLVETFRWEEYWGSKIQMSEGFSCRNGC